MDESEKIALNLAHFEVIRSACEAEARKEAIVVCPECGGRMWRMLDRPDRYYCDTGANLRRLDSRCSVKMSEEVYAELFEKEVLRLTKKKLEKDIKWQNSNY